MAAAAQGVERDCQGQPTVCQELCSRSSQKTLQSRVPTGTNDLYLGPLRPQRLFSVRVGEALHVLEAEFPASSEGGGRVEVQAGLYLFKGNKHKCRSL